MEFPINSIADFEKLSREVKWQYFERLVGYIFEQNGFGVRVGIIVKDGFGVHGKARALPVQANFVRPVKRQFDVIAERYGLTYLIECKKWKSRREYNSAVRFAVRKHMERCELYKEVKGNGVPVIVTLIEGEVEQHDGVPIVPITKLNWFINEPR
jgi:hypothetical protein